MLTNTDLKAIGSLFDRKFEAALDKKMEPLLDRKLLPIRMDIKRIIRHIDIHDLEVDKRIKKLEEDSTLKLQQL